MKILISNDDGCQAEGIRILADKLGEDSEITVVAPDRNRSGASNSLTLGRPLRATSLQNGYISVDGTPTDCVHLALTGLMKDKPDLVVSGINHGANMGDDVLYSGTVAAAMEGRFLGLPAIAVSIVSIEPRFFQTAAQVVSELIKRFHNHPLPADTILNVNVPDCPYTELKGFAATRLGQRHRSEVVIQDTDPRGRTIYWIGPAGDAADAGVGTDFHAIDNKWVSVTPVHVDFTHFQAMDGLASWLKDSS